MQLIIIKLKEVDFDALSPSSECPADHLQKLKLAVPEVGTVPFINFYISAFTSVKNLIRLSPFVQRFQVLQTLLEAEQVCAELQHSVSGLDWRLAELQLWITEAREVYQHLKTTDRQRRGQDPRARVSESRSSSKKLRRQTAFPASTSAGSDISRAAAGGSGGHRGSGPSGDGDDESEELSHPVSPRFCNAGTSARRRRPVTGLFSHYQLAGQMVQNS